MTLRDILVFFLKRTRYSWGYQVGMLGEKLQIFSEQGLGQVQWRRFSNAFNPVIWYKTS
ncbi:hypothetical protein LINPERHAP2_LOCUS22801 [Linum perenne]